MRMRHIVICGLPGSTIFFHIISQTARFSGKVIKYKLCVFILSAMLSETFLILRRIQQDIITNVHMYSRKVSVTLVRRS